MKNAAFTACLLAILLAAGRRSEAQVPGVGLATGAIKKVIVALDLKVQQMQNKVIALQNAQKQLENELSLDKLNDISGWLGREKELYQSYYQELAKVKDLISDYGLVRRTIRRQVQLAGEYKRAWTLFSHDRHFNGDELRYMETIYSGILGESLKNLDELLIAVTGTQTSMDDGERLWLIVRASGALQRNLDHLRRFNSQNAALSYSRSADEEERKQVKQLYGIQ
jgi:hypothetical protein